MACLFSSMLLPLLRIAVALLPIAVALLPIAVALSAIAFSRAACASSSAFFWPARATCKSAMSFTAPATSVLSVPSCDSTVDSEVLTSEICFLASLMPLASSTSLASKAVCKSATFFCSASTTDWSAFLAIASLRAFWAFSKLATASASSLSLASREVFRASTCCCSASRVA